MRRRKLDIAHAHNSAKIIISLHKLVDEFDLKNEQDHQISTLIEKIEGHLSSTPDSDGYLLWQIVTTSLHALRSQLKCHKIARGGNGDILSERETLSILCSDLRGQLLKYYAEDDNNTLLIDGIIKHDNRGLDLDNFISFLQSIPLPLTYWRKIGDNYPFSRNVSENESEISVTPLVRLIAFIDDAPLVSPQLLQPQLMYSLKFVVRGVVWHKEASHLRLDLLTTYPASDYSVSPFILQTPELLEDDEYEGKFAGHIRFGTAQTILSDSISFVVRCGFQLSDSCHTPIHCFVSNG